MINKTYDIKPDLSNISMAIIKKLNQVIDHLNAVDKAMIMEYMGLKDHSFVSILTNTEPDKEIEYCCSVMQDAVKDGDVVMRGRLHTAWERDGVWTFFRWCPFCGTRLEG